MDEPTPKPSENKKEEKSKKKIPKWLHWVLLLLLLLGIGYLVWLYFDCKDSEKTLQGEKTQLQQQVDDLKKQLEEAKAAEDDDDDQAAASTCDGTVSASVKENITASIETMNTAALEGYMASAVNVVFAASEKGGDVSPTQAIADLEYLQSATDPWNFNLPAATINGYKAGFYAQYFPANAHVGKSANDYVVSFGFNNCGKINMIFVAASAELL